MTEKREFQHPFSEVSTQTQLHKAYSALKELVNGTSILAPIAGTVDEPVEFFLARYKEKPLTFSDRQLSLSHASALCSYLICISRTHRIQTEEVGRV
jgi:hypothetical protein